jgi:hypothetical protein
VTVDARQNLPLLGAVPARRPERVRDVTSDDDDGKGDGGWLVAAFAAIALGTGAVVAWRTCRRTDVPE